MPAKKKLPERTNFAIHAEGLVAGDNLEAARAIAAKLATVPGVSQVFLSASGVVETIHDDQAQRRHFDHGGVAFNELERLLTDAEDDEFEKRIFGAVETAKQFGVDVDEKKLEARRPGLLKVMQQHRRLHIEGKKVEA